MAKTQKPDPSAADPGVPKVSPQGLPEPSASTDAELDTGADTAPVTDDGDNGDAQPEGPVLVLMEREGVSADVHPLEVANYAAGGWRQV